MPNNVCNTPEHLNAKGFTKGSFTGGQCMGEISIRHSQEVKITQNLTGKIQKIKELW